MSLSDILQITSTALNDIDERAQISSLSRLEGEIKQRIFNRGEAADGTAIGNYRSRQHIGRRQSTGRQTAYKDLELSGELRRSIQIGKSGGKNSLGFTTDRSRLIAEAQQTPLQTGKIIFAASEREIELTTQSYVDEIQFALRKQLE